MRSIKEIKKEIEECENKVDSGSLGFYINELYTELEKATQNEKKNEYPSIYGMELSLDEEELAYELGLEDYLD